MKKAICMIAFLVLLHTACKKEDNASKTELLTSHCWVLSGATVDPAVVINGAVVTDGYAILPLCERDNVTCILENGSLYVDEGASKCDPNDPQTAHSGKWWFNADETILLAQIDGATDTVPSDILQLDKQTLQIMQHIELFGQLRNVTFTYKPE